jgi:hypothetical protein
MSAWAAACGGPSRAKAPTVTKTANHAPDTFRGQPAPSNLSPRRTLQPIADLIPSDEKSCGLWLRYPLFLVTTILSRAALPELLLLVLRLLGLPLDPPQVVVQRVLSDLGAVARVTQEAPRQFARMLELGEEIAAIGRAVLEIAERLDRRAEAILELGERLDRRAEAIIDLGVRLDARAEAIIDLGARLDAGAEAIIDLGARLDVRTAELIELGTRMHDLGDRVDARGGEVADQAAAVVATAHELITVLPALERALDIATPLEGAIDRFGRLVDRLPGGRRPDAGAHPAPPPRPIGKPPLR